MAEGEPGRPLPRSFAVGLDPLTVQEPRHVRGEGRNVRVAVVRALRGRTGDDRGEAPVPERLFPGKQPEKPPEAKTSARRSTPPSPLSCSGAM